MARKKAARQAVSARPWVQVGHCPLCASAAQAPYWQDKNRDYYQCTQCQLVWVPSVFHLNSDAEKAEYDKHDNHGADEGYIRFLDRTWQPYKAVLNKLAQQQEKKIRELQLLDFGCGEGAVLSQMAKQEGYQMHNYDLYYHPNHDYLKQQYQGISLTEVLEHLAQPAQILTQLDAILSKHGVLAIMTKRVRDKAAFATWHYKNDPTHLCFYSEATFAWIAKQYHWQVIYTASDVVLFIKS